jgi:hypothetical protein
MLRHGPLASFLEDSGQSEIAIRGLSASAEVVQRYQPYLRPSTDGALHFVLPLKLQRELIERTWAAGGELVSVSPLRRTLEDLFVAWSEEGRA